jgi:hypothetical protein
VGEELFHKLMQYKDVPPSALGTTLSVKPYVRLLLLPSSSGGINAWEVTLLIVSILLVTSFLASGKYIQNCNNTNIYVVRSYNALAYLEKKKKTTALDRTRINTYSSRNATYGEANI